MKLTKSIICSIPLLMLSANSMAYDPRSYVLLPNNMNLADINYAYMTTNKLLLNSAKVKNVAETVSVRYLRTFDLFGTLGAAYVQLPYTKNRADISLGPMKLHEKMNGMSDARLFFAVGVYNMPSLSREQFAKHDKDGTKAACSTALNIPNGEYDQKNLVNVGNKQYSLKSECIATYTKNRFMAEFASGFTKYTDNKDYAPGRVKSQDNMYHSEVHLSYNLTPKVWTSFDVFYLKGGEQSINNVSSKDKMDNTLVGIMASYNVAKGAYVKANYIKTVSSPKYAAKTDYVILHFNQLF